MSSSREEIILHHENRRYYLLWNTVKYFTVGTMLKYCINKIYGTERFSYLVRRRDNLGIYFWCEESYNVNTRIDTLLNSGDPIFLINLSSTPRRTERIITLEDVENTPSNMTLVTTSTVGRQYDVDDVEEEEEEGYDEDPEVIPDTTFEIYSWLLSPFTATLLSPSNNNITFPEEVKRVINESTYNKICHEIPKPKEFFCVICQTDEDAKIVEIQSCKHSFHDACIKEWLTCQNITCAYCRKVVVTEPSEYGYLGASEILPPTASPIVVSGLPSILNMHRSLF